MRTQLVRPHIDISRGAAFAPFGCGHLGTVRHRAKVVEYRVEQHRKVLKTQLAALRVGAGKR